MSLHPILKEKLNAAVQAYENSWTRRDAQLPLIKNKVHAVIGMRRSGKTTFLHQLVAERRREVSNERAIYLSFDDDRLMELELSQLDHLIESYFRQYPEFRGKKTVYLFFDEIQLVSGWERFVRRVIDTEKIEFVVSGSSAKMLSKEVHTSLRGRGIPTTIHPFGFREFLRHREKEPTKLPDRWTPAERSWIEKYFNEFLVVGGFPEAQDLPLDLRVELLQGYVDVVLLRDVVERYNMSNVSVVRWVLRHLLRNPAGSFSVHKIVQDLRSQGHRTSKDSIYALLDHFFDAFLFTSVSLATDSERQRNSNPKKIYPIDPGLIHSFDARARSNLGHALETIVANELERRGYELYYVKTSQGFEVDFYARHRSLGEELVQVSVELSTPETLQRELRALGEAKKMYPKARQRLIVMDRETKIKLMNEKIDVDMIWDWLLKPPVDNL